jgi:hypothetical protein
MEVSSRSTSASAGSSPPEQFLALAPGIRHEQRRQRPFADELTVLSPMPDAVAGLPVRAAHTFENSVRRARPSRTCRDFG